MMLTLTRKIGETIRIGDDIEIVVREIRKNQVRIGIVAPKNVKIYREEIYESIQSERRSIRRPLSSGKQRVLGAICNPASPEPFGKARGEVLVGRLKAINGEGA